MNIEQTEASCSKVVREDDQSFGMITKNVDVKGASGPSSHGSPSHADTLMNDDQHVLDDLSIDVDPHNQETEETIAMHLEKHSLDEKCQIADEIGQSERPTTRQHDLDPASRDLNTLLFLDVGETPADACKPIYAFLSGIGGLSLDDVKNKT